MNEAQTTTRKEVLRDVARKAGVSQSVIKTQVKKYNATVRKMRSRVWAGFRKQKPVYKINKKLNSKVARMHTPKDATSRRFYASMPESGHTGIFVRVGHSVRKSPRGYTKNLPIAEVVLDIRQMAEESISTLAPRVAKERFQIRFEHNMKRELTALGFRTR